MHDEQNDDEGEDTGYDDQLTGLTLNAMGRGRLVVGHSDGLLFRLEMRSRRALRGEWRRAVSSDVVNAMRRGDHMPLRRGGRKESGVWRGRKDSKGGARREGSTRESGMERRRERRRWRGTYVRRSNLLSNRAVEI